MPGWVRLTGRFLMSEQDAEKVAFPTRPTRARPDVPRPMLHSRRAQRLNVPKRTPRLSACCGFAGQPF
jgi:hypothetical protein